MHKSKQIVRIDLNCLLNPTLNVLLCFLHQKKISHYNLAQTYIIDCFFFLFFFFLFIIADLCVFLSSTLLALKTKKKKKNKETKNQWARDDPAFVAIFACFAHCDHDCFTLWRSAHSASLPRLSCSLGTCWSTFCSRLCHCHCCLALVQSLPCVFVAVFTRTVSSSRSSGSTRSTFIAMPSFRSFCCYTCSISLLASFAVRSLCRHADRQHPVFSGARLLLARHVSRLQCTAVSAKDVVFVYPTAVLVVLYFVALGLGWNASLLSAEFSLWRIGL
jgi:hypothetical protein